MAAAVYPQPVPPITEMGNPGAGGERGGPDRSAAKTRPTLLTNRLCGRDKRRAGAARRHVSVPDAASLAVAARSRHAQKACIMAISSGFCWPVKQPTVFRFGLFGSPSKSWNITHWLTVNRPIRACQRPKAAWYSFPVGILKERKSSCAAGAIIRRSSRWLAKGVLSSRRRGRSGPSRCNRQGPGLATFRQVTTHRSWF